MENMIYALLERFSEELIFDNPEHEDVLREIDNEHTMERVVHEMITILDDYVDEIGK